MSIRRVRGSGGKESSLRLQALLSLVIPQQLMLVLLRVWNFLPWEPTLSVGQSAPTICSLLSGVYALHPV